jgi:carbamoyltransferase
MLILGISALEHDATAALVRDGQVLAAMEEDKLNRTPTYGGIPRLAMEQCARQVGVKLSEIPVVAMAAHPRRAWLREERFRLSLLARHPAASFGTGAMGRVYRAMNHKRQMRPLFNPQTRWVQFEHHLCHAAGAFFSSPFDRALVLTLDESGDMWGGLVALGEGKNLRPLHALSFPNSPGWLYSRITECLGFRPKRDEHKTQWLGKNGRPQFLPALRKIFARDARGLPVLRREFLGAPLAGRWGISPQFLRELKLSPDALRSDPAARADLARSAQDWLEEIVLEIAENFRKKTGATQLCLAGGVFLNVLLVRALETRSGFTSVHVQPVAGNSGTSLGAAWLAARELGANWERKEMRHSYLGPEFASDQIKAVLDNCKVIYHYYRSDAELLDATVELLRKDKIVAWYQGRMEFGLRALGNRSILASPFSPYVIDNLNQYIKHREDFHPFALSVPQEAAGGIFDCTSNCRFMSSMGMLRSAVQGLEPFTFRGRDVRVHVVEREANPRFHDLLTRFSDGQPAPVLVNTSFNLFGEPLVCEPREAVRSFYCCGIDSLVIGNFIVEK